MWPATARDLSSRMLVNHGLASRSNSSNTMMSRFGCGRPPTSRWRYPIRAAAPTQIVPLCRISLVRQSPSPGPRPAEMHCTTGYAGDPKAWQAPSVASVVSSLVSSSAIFVPGIQHDYRPPSGNQAGSKRLIDCAPGSGEPGSGEHSSAAGDAEQRTLIGWAVRA